MQHKHENTAPEHSADYFGNDVLITHHLNPDNGDAWLRIGAEGGPHEKLFCRDADAWERLAIHCQDLATQIRQADAERVFHAQAVVAAPVVAFNRHASDID